MYTSNIGWQLISRCWISHKHNYEGSDDLPAHLKSSLLGSTISIPITDGKLNLGTWQGIYLCEHRNQGTKRKIVATMIGIHSEN